MNELHEEMREKLRGMTLQEVRDLAFEMYDRGEDIGPMVEYIRRKETVKE